MDKKLDTKRLGVLTAAGLGVATLCAGIAFAVSGGGNEQPERDTVPVGQLVSTPDSTPPSSSSEPPAAVVADPPKDTATVTNPPVQQPAPQPAPANEPATTPPTTMPTGENGAPLNPAPAPSQPPTLCDGQPCESWDPRAPHPTTT